MAFWDFLRPKKPITPAPIAPTEFGGAMRDGKKHGPWVEREEHEDTEWDAETRTFKKLGTYGWREHTYVDGVKQGAFVWRWSNGVVLREGTYVDDKIDGTLVVRRRTGEVAGEGTFKAGELHGHWVQRHANGNVDYECHYDTGKRHGAWSKHHENGQLAEQGMNVAGERDGVWRCWDAAGVLLEEGPYKADKRHGAWKLRRADGSICAEGEYAAGAMTGPWVRITAAGAASVPRSCADEAELARWSELEQGVELISAYAPTQEWIERAKTAFAELAQPWQVTARKDQFGQTILSAPLTAGTSWQMRVAVGVPVQTAIRDEVWSRIIGAIDKIGVSQRAEAVAIVERAGLLSPTFAPRDWLTAILEDEADDPRTRIVSRFEPGREFDSVRARRFQQRVPHLQELSLRECSLPIGFAVLFERGYPELERLLVVRNDVTGDSIIDLYALLARAPWVGKLTQLAIVDNGAGATDEQLGALLANPAFGALTFLTLDSCTLGPETARALREGAAASSLESLDLRYSTLDVAALTAIAACPALEELELRSCELPTMTSREAMAIRSTALRDVKLARTLGVESYARGEKRSGYAVARRLAVMPALANIEKLDLSDNHLDGLAARAFARSPYLAKLARLDWTGNEEDGYDGLDELRAALPADVLVTDEPKRGNVVVVSP